MSTAWRFQESQGYMYDSDYPYVSGATRTETECAHDTSKIKGRTTLSGYNRIFDVASMKQAVARQPLTIAIDGGQSIFQ